jgi:virulence factor
MKTAVIGLGNIAQKAYLPIITQIEEVEPYFCTRNEEELNRLAKKYRVDKTYSSFPELLKEDIDAAFVHTATEAHYDYVKELLERGIPTYVDKPITCSIDKTEELIKIAKVKKVVLMTGFNRRYIPTYHSLLEISGPKIITMQKNRKLWKNSVRDVVLIDFIHVIDTILYLYGENEIKSIEIDKYVEDDSLLRVMLTLKGKENIAVGIMNRDSAVGEEVVEVMGFKQKMKVKNVTEVIKYQNDGENISLVPGWNKMGYNRGFVDIIDRFLELARKGEPDLDSLNADLKTHRLCERIIEE